MELTLSNGNATLRMTFDPADADAVCVAVTSFLRGTDHTNRPGMNLWGGVTPAHKAYDMKPTDVNQVLCDVSGSIRVTTAYGKDGTRREGA